MDKVKHKYEVTFVYPHHFFVEYTSAVSERHAYVAAANKVAKKQDVDPWQVLKYFKENPDKVKVKLEVEFKEVEDESSEG